MKFVDVSGFGHSGKTVVTDYLKQYDCVFSFPNHIEFELIRVPGGLLDLYFSIYESWNLIRSTVRINEFKTLVKRIGKIQSMSSPISYFTASAHGYDQHFNHKFIEISNRFIDKVITAKQITFWPYENLRVHPFLVFYNKFKSKFFNSLLKSEIYFSNRNDFLNYTEAYMNELFSEVVGPEQTHVVLNNGFEPFNSGLCLDIVGDAFSIIVDRDPRDIYASQINVEDVFVPNFEKDKRVDGIKKIMTGFNDIDHFLFRYKTLKENVIKNEADSRIIKINYEEFILNHEDCARKIKSIIGISNTANLVNDTFDISKSRKNVGLWRKYADLPEIKRIGDELGEFCYDY